MEGWFTGINYNEAELRVLQQAWHGAPRSSWDEPAALDEIFRTISGWMLDKHAVQVYWQNLQRRLLDVKDVPSSLTFDVGSSIARPNFHVIKEIIKDPFDVGSSIARPNFHVIKEIIKDPTRLIVVPDHDKPLPFELTIKNVECLANELEAFNRTLGKCPTCGFVGVPEDDCPVCRGDCSVCQTHPCPHEMRWAARSVIGARAGRSNAFIFNIAREDGLVCKQRSWNHWRSGNPITICDEEIDFYNSAPLPDYTLQPLSCLVCMEGET